MSARVPPDFFEAIFKYSGPGQSGEVQTALGFSGGDPLDGVYRLSFVDATVGPLTEQVSSSCSIIAVDFRVGSDGADDLVISEPVTEVGDQGPEMFPLSTTFLLTKSTGAGGRRNRGRMYIPGVPEASVENDGTLDTAALTGWNSDISGMLGLIDALSPPTAPVLFHETAPFTPTPVVALTIVNLVASQRRRLRG